MSEVPKKQIPEFKTDEDLAEFWDTHDFADYVHDTEPVEGVEFAKLRLKQVCLRLSPFQVQHLKRIAATKGIGYQTMLRMWITERQRQEEAAEPVSASPPSTP